MCILYYHVWKIFLSYKRFKLNNKKPLWFDCCPAIEIYCNCWCLFYIDQQNYPPSLTISSNLLQCWVSFVSISNTCFRHSSPCSSGYIIERVAWCYACKLPDWSRGCQRPVIKIWKTFLKEIHIGKIRILKAWCQEFKF